MYNRTVLLHTYILSINFGDMVTLKGGKQGVTLSKKPAYQLNAIQELHVKGSRIALLSQRRRQELRQLDLHLLQFS